MEDGIQIILDKKTYEQFLEFSKISQRTVVNELSNALRVYIKDKKEEYGLNENKNQNKRVLLEG